jgi:hypothetical protein
MILSGPKKVKNNALHVMTWNVNNKSCRGLVDSIVGTKIGEFSGQPIVCCLQEVPFNDLDESDHCFFELMVGMHSDEPGGLRFPKYTKWGPSVVLPKGATFLNVYNPTYFEFALRRVENGGTELGIRSTKWITFSLNGHNYAVISVHCTNKPLKRDKLIPSIFADGKSFADAGFNVVIAGDFNTTPEQWKKYDLCGFQTDKSSFDTSDDRRITNINPDGSFYDRIDYIFTCFKNDMVLDKEEIKGIINTELPRCKRTFCTEMKEKGHDHAIVIDSFSLSTQKN